MNMSRGYGIAREGEDVGGGGGDDVDFTVDLPLTVTTTNHSDKVRLPQERTFQQNPSPRHCISPMNFYVA